MIIGEIKVRQISKVILHDWDYEEKKHNNICDI
jgi:hypothetical protein